MDGGEEIPCGFVIARGDRAELFEFTKEIFDQVAFLVNFPVEFSRCQAVWPRRDNSRFAGARQGREDPGVGVEGFVGDQAIGHHGRQQRVGAGQIVHLSGGQQKRQRIAERVDQGVDLGAQPTPAMPDRLILVFFLSAPALC